MVSWESGLYFSRNFVFETRLRGTKEKKEQVWTNITSSQYLADICIKLRCSVSAGCEMSSKI